MSDTSSHDRDARPELADADEQALRGLLTRAHRPPRLRPAARASILAALSARQAELAAGDPAAERVAKPATAPSHLRARRLAGWVAVLAAAALIGLWLRAASQPVLYDNAGTLPRAVSLDDGTTMVLDGGARVVARRTGELELVQGRALFDVPVGSAYVLASDHGRVVAEGTRLILSRDRTSTHAAVARGRARVFSDAGEAEVAAGDQAILRPGTAPSPEPARRLTYLAAWARETLAAQEPAEARPLRRGNLKARVPDSSTEWPLPMRRLTVDVVVDDDAVRTTFDHTFFNHVNRDLEGLYTFSLPSDAAVSRLAMYVDGKLMEGGIVERNRGRDVYEDIVYRRRDPALLEWMSGNELSVRIFPLPARTEKRILMSYTQTVERLYDTRRLVVPIPEIDTPVEHVTYRIRVADGARYELASTSHVLSIEDDGADRVATFEADDHVIGRDLVMTLREREPASRHVRGYEDDTGRFLLARIQPALRGARGARAPRDWVVLFDTSASRDPQAMSAQEQMLLRLVGELDTFDRFAVVAFDATRRVMAGGFHRVGGFDRRVLEAFLAAEAHDAIGVTDLSAALTEAAGLLGDRAGDILYLGDGVATAGLFERGALKKLIGERRFVGVGVGDRADATVLRDLASSSGGLFAHVSSGEDLGWRAFDLVAELNTSRLAGVKAQIVDAAGEPVAGEVHVDAQATGGEDVVVLARFDKRQKPHEIVLTGTADGEPWTERIGVAEAPLDAKFLPRLWARRHIEALASENETANREVITELGLANFLVTPFTSLLVLETEADYTKHQVVRPATDSWARYEAPAQIEVVREPLEVAAAPYGAVVLRSAQRGTGAGYGFDLDSTIVDLPMRGGRDVFLPQRRRGALRSSANFGRLEEASSWARQPVEPRAGATGRTGAHLGGQKKPPFGGPRLAGGKSGYFMPTVPMSKTAFIDQGILANGWWGGYAIDLEDLTQLLPQLFADAIDDERENARRVEADGKRGVVDGDARALLDGALREPARYRTTSGAEINVTPSGFIVVRRTAMGLREELVFDGQRLVGLYPDALITTDRDAKGATMAALEQHAPFVVPHAADLDGHYHVTRVGTRAVRIEPVGGGAATVLTLDAAGRVVGWEHAGVVLTMRWDREALRIQQTGRADVVLDRISESPATSGIATDASWTSLRLPLVELASTQRAVAVTVRGEPAWRAAQRQLLATQAAQGRADWQVIDDLRAAGLSPTRGELVLASGGLVPAAAKWLSQGEPVAAYLRAVLRYRAGDGVAAFEPLARADSFVASISAYRSVMQSYEKLSRGLRRYEALAALPVSAHVRLTALSHLSYQAGADDLDDVIEKLDALAADPDVAVTARYAAAQQLAVKGRYAAAAKRFESALATGDAGGVYLPVDYQVRSAFVSRPGGEGAFRRLVLTRRARLITVGTDEALLAALSMLDTFGTPEDIEGVLNALRQITIDDPAQAHALATILLRRGFVADAERIVLDHIESGPLTFEMLLLAAQAAELDNRHREAAAFVARAMAKHEAMPLGELRNLYQRRFELNLAAARASSAPNIDEALAVAAAWRREDPDNATIDRLCFDALTSRGDHPGAYRHLSSIIERHPGEGSAYDEVARALSQQGQLVAAERTIRRAIDVEPTNPNWLLTQSEMLEALGEADQARAVLRRVAERTWQERFAPQVADAKRRLDL